MLQALRILNSAAIVVILPGKTVPMSFTPKNKIRIVTAASLFDGHDASINIMRRIMQANGAEVIHLGHDRAVQEVVDTAIQEDANAIAITSYQGGHVEYFKYMYDLLKERGCSHIKLFGGGGGVILPTEIEELHNYGITRIYSPDDGRAMGLEGMIIDLLEQSDYPTGNQLNGEVAHLIERDAKSVARLISAAENFPESAETQAMLKKVREQAGTGAESTSQLVNKSTPPVLGITGTGGAGKSSLVDEIVRRFLLDFPDKTGGALLGDRIRMNAIRNPRIYMRSMATRQSNLAVSRHIKDAVDILKAAKFDLIVLETSGIGQSDTQITDYCDASLYVMTPEYGAATQLEKIDMLDFADIVCINKFDKRGAMDALRDVKKQYQRNHKLFTSDADTMPVYGTIASQFNDPGTNTMYHALMDMMERKIGTGLKSTFVPSEEMSEKIFIIPPARTRYLSEISENNRKYDQWARDQSAVAQKLFGIRKTIDTIGASKIEDGDRLIKSLEEVYQKVTLELDPKNLVLLQNWEAKKRHYQDEFYVYRVRDKELRIKTHTESLSHTQVPKVAVPKFEAWGEILLWALSENFPGEFPYAAGIYPFKREGEDPTRMFAGEGGPERTNKRFHYVSKGLPAKRLSTAFDSVTLYGQDPDHRPDIYGKIGNSGVSVPTLDDAKKLYSGFNLADPKTSVSMTINGPAPTIAAFFMNAAIDQQCELYIRANGLVEEVQQKIDAIYKDKGIDAPAYSGGIPEGNDGLGLMLLGLTADQVLPADVYAKIKADTLKQVRGTVQADILKEDQAQNTCIFSTEFSLRVMGDVQQYFIDQGVRNFYSVSISGYHIAEAGANPISQLAFTIANGFTFVEYYLSRGMNIDDFAPNLSFFFSNGVDPEYSVIGRVARRIWAKAMKLKYGGNERSQMLKYHIQTSGRSLHAQEIDFNDIRTTLQALYAIYDNCNSLHTNAYDEAITTPTEESVRRAMAIQLIINKELGLASWWKKPY